MSDEQITDSDLGGQGVEKRAGYTPMLRPTENTPAPEPDPIADDERYTPLSAKDAARELGESRRNRGAEEEVFPPIERAPAEKPIPREYVRQSGRDAGRPMPANETVPIEAASDDLRDLRAQERAAEEAALNEELARAVDSARSGETQQPDQPQEGRQQTEQPAQPVDDVWQRPEVISAVSDYTNQVGGAVQQLEAKFLSEIQANAMAATQTIFASVPELQGLQTAEQLQTALGIIERQDPRRAQMIRGHIQNVQALNAKAVEVQQQQAQQYQQAYQQQFAAEARQHDDAYDAWITKQEPDPGRRQQISTTAKQMLHEAGFNDQQLAQEWSWNPMLRSFGAQQILADAARFRLARNGIKTRTANPVPKISRPGSPAERPTEQQYNLSKYNDELNKTGSAKAAAALLSARRANRR